MSQETNEGPAAQPVDAPSDDPAESADSVSVADDRVMIGIRTREAARIYHFSAPRGTVFQGDYVVIDRGRGDQLARVVTVPDDDASGQPVPRDVRPIVRIADGEDRTRANEQADRAERIVEEMRSASARSNLGLYPVAVELNLSGERGVVWFQANDHVDFRSLLDDVQDRFDVQLQMQQVNQRERARLVDGYDICGLRLCCSSWMTDFPQVGIRVAKDQDLSLNPDSISGVCGRLLCCLTFEHEVYREMRGALPRVGKRVSTPAGMGKVIKLNVLQQQVTIALDDHPQRVDVPADEIGLAVRTEEAPNQALVEAERARREDDERAANLRRAAAPAEAAGSLDSDDPDNTDSAGNAEQPPTRPARRRRRRSGQSRREQAAQPHEQSDRESTTDSADSTEATQSSKPKRSSRRRRRRQPKVMNQSESPQTANESAPNQQQDGEARRPRRRRRRSRQPVNQPESRPPADTSE